jgi:hypothetical protein
VSGNQGEAFITPAMLSAQICSISRSCTTTAAVVLNLIQSLVMSNSATTGAGVANNGDAASMNTYRSRLAYNVASASGGGAWN